jgi:AcrR family transcriptional regulator
MRLFGEQGYAATTIAQIEAAAGLSPGSGSLYKHFRSKAAVLTEGITRIIDAGEQLRALLDAPSDSPVASLPLRERVAFVADAGLQRLVEERDFNRILMRDLQSFPDLLSRARDDEIRHNHLGLSTWLAAQAGGKADRPAPHDWEAIAAVLMDATAHYWLLRDIFGGEHPTGISQTRYLNALVDLLTSQYPQETDEPTDTP